MKKKISIFISCLLILTQVVQAFALTDDFIMKDPVANTYAGRQEARDLISNLNFTDVSGDFWAKDAIVRSGALNMVKGYADRFSPNDSVSNQEAIAFILRAIGLEGTAQQAAVNVQGQLPADSPLRTLWSLGYLNTARQIGLLTAAQYADALVADQTTLDPAANFMRTASVTREQLADWLVRALQTVDANVFATTATQQAIYTFSDWESIGVDKVAAVESVAANRIMVGDSNGRFRPKASLTRAEMAQVLKNMDSIYYQMNSIEKKTGTVGAIADAQLTATATTDLWRNIYVRVGDGSIDVLQYQMADNSSPQRVNADAVVLRGGSVGGLPTLAEGDQIEYLVRPSTGQVLYVQVTNAPVETKSVSGNLVSVETGDGVITISDANGKYFTYPMAQGLYGESDGTAYVLMSQKRRDTATLPKGSRVSLTLKNNIVDRITYIGEPVVIDEIRGIVTDNNPEFGYLTVFDNNGNEVTKYYNEGDLKVKKTQYYDMEDEIGYIAEMFPNFLYDPRETDISDIEPGDIVFIRVSEDDTDRIANISASTNYLARYGKILELTTSGNMSSLLIEYESKQTAWFDVAGSIFISKDGRPITVADIQVGDWAKLLINQAIITPGQVIESVKELTIEGDEHYISTIVKGRLAGINSIQNQLQVQNVQTLTKTGWNNYKDMEQYSIAGKDIEYYYEGNRVSLDYAVKNLKRSNGDVYIALENNYSGEKVKRVTFRTGRDELLSPDTVVSADGNGSFSIVSNNGTITTDAGTIVRRFGRLVSGSQISSPDYAVVSLNGENRAAVVDITTAPDTTGVMIARGRISSVNDGVSFKVQSMSQLSGNSWNYTPVQREFSIDYDTLFLNAGGYVSNDTFIGYTTGSVVDKVYNIVADGSRAAMVVDSPYSTKAMRGTIYQINGSTVSIKNATYLDESTGKWIAVSNTDATATVTLGANSIMVKNNQTIQAYQLQVGDQIMALTDSMPQTIRSGVAINGYIIFVEK